MSKSIDRDECTRAFGVLLKSCLNVGPSDELVVIFDESLEQFESIFFSEVTREDLSVTYIYLPREQQLKLSGGSGRTRPLPSGILTSISASAALITFLSANPDTLPARRLIVNQTRPGNCRFAHIPGISDSVLKVLAASPIEEIYRKCEQIAWALGEAKELELRTIDPQGHRHVLHLSAGGWANEPLMSPGILVPGSWGNVPPGETFCCPDEGTTHGTVFINGSIPGTVLPSKTGFLLTFKKGVLTAWEPIGNFENADFFDKELKRAERDGDLKWNVLAEFGVGANPVIKKLTGNMLFDEKAYRTIHIAIGDNFVFGRFNESNIHHDLVVKKPTVLVNDWIMIEDGELLEENIKRIRSAPIGENILNLDVILDLRKGRMRIRDDLLERMLQSGVRIGYVTIAPPKIARALADVVKELNTYREVSVQTFSRDYPNFQGIDTIRLLECLKHYYIVELRQVG